jgi:hypothetical protein
MAYTELFAAVIEVLSAPVKATCFLVAPSQALLLKSYQASHPPSPPLHRHQPAQVVLRDHPLRPHLQLVLLQAFLLLL